MCALPNRAGRTQSCGPDLGASGKACGKDKRLEEGYVFLKRLDLKCLGQYLDVQWRLKKQQAATSVCSETSAYLRVLRPGLNNAGSNVSGRFVAIRTWRSKGFN